MKRLQFETKEEYHTRLKLINAHKEDLPHLFGMQFYKWQREYLNGGINDGCKDFHLVAANQVGKSTINWIKAIHWATEWTLWNKLWPRDPKTFWYLYPSLGLATREFTDKIIDLLPRGKFRDHPIYKWEVEKKRGEIYAIRFPHVSIYTRSYFQKEVDSQASTVHAVFTDEELPEQLYDELNVRRSGITCDGHFHMTYTATLGQDLWRRTMEPAPYETEKFPEAKKWNISLYDCLEYEDGSPSLWTIEQIEKRKAKCKNRAEIQKRIYGRFVKDEDLRYYTFDRKKHVVRSHKLPKNWLIYSGVDIGSGGTGTGHPAAICFVAVNPEFTKGRVIFSWRGDDIDTTSSDILKKYIQLRGKLKPVGEYYDWQSKDFYLTAKSLNIPFQPADKKQEMGEDLINDLFKNDMIKIHLADEEDENMKLIIELESLTKNVKKSNAIDDAIDAFRFAITRIPWDFSEMNNPYIPETKDQYGYMDEREKMRRGIVEDEETIEDLVELELEMAGEVYDYGLGGGDYD